jgi:hypothetical protein
MPKLNPTHLPERLKKRIEQLEGDEALEARDINVLLNKEQQQALKTAWAAQQALRKQHKPPKTNTEKAALGWKTIREVRLDIYRQALEDAQNGLGDVIQEIHQQSDIKAARVFMDAFSSAGKEGKNAWSAGNIALTRAGFSRVDGLSNATTNKRDIEVNAMEDALRKQFEAEMTDDEKEQLALSKAHDKTTGK